MNTPGLSYPSFIAEGCRECPSLQNHLGAWRDLQARQDIAVQRLTDDALIEAAAVNISVVHLGHEPDQQPSLEAKVEALRELESRTYDNATSAIQTLEVDMKVRVNSCIDKKPATARIPHKNGALLVKICGAVMETTCEHNDHETVVSIRRRKSQD